MVIIFNPQPLLVSWDATIVLIGETMEVLMQILKATIPLSIKK